MTGGMLPQQDDALAIIELCRRRGKPVAVGGPDAMSSPDTYRHADFLVLGEAEGLIDQFVAAWSAGAESRRVRRREIPGRRHQEPDAALRPAQFRALSLYRRAVLPRLPVQLRILRHHRALWPGAARQDQRADARRARHALPARPSRPCGFRRRQSHRQQEGAQALPAGADRLAEGARLSVPVLHRSLDESRRRCGTAADAAGSEFLPHLRRHRKSGYERR